MYKKSSKQTNKLLFIGVWLILVLLIGWMSTSNGTHDVSAQVIFNDETNECNWYAHPLDWGADPFVFKAEIAVDDTGAEVFSSRYGYLVTASFYTDPVLCGPAHASDNMDYSVELFLVKLDPGNVETRTSLWSGELGGREGLDPDFNDGTFQFWVSEEGTYRVEWENDNLDNPAFRSSEFTVTIPTGTVIDPDNAGQKWLTLMCVFNDQYHAGSPYLNNGPHTPHRYSDYLDTPHFQRMYDDPNMGMNEYFRKNSFGQLNLDGSLASGWHWLPKGRVDAIRGGVNEGYMTRDNIGNYTDVDGFIEDCVEASGISWAELTEQYAGINFFPSRPLVRDSGIHQFAPPHEMMYTVNGRGVHNGTLWLAIEMGKAYGMETSYVRVDDETKVKDSSDWDLLGTTKNPCNTQPGLKGQDTDANDGVNDAFGCQPQYNAAFQRANMGWITDSEIVELEYPKPRDGIVIGSASDGLDGNKKMIRITNPNDPDSPYTIELRSKSSVDSDGRFNFDRILPPFENTNGIDLIPATESFVIIHKGNELLDGDAQQEWEQTGRVDSADPEARWTTGEKYLDDHIEIEIVEIDDTNRTATINVHFVTKWINLLCAFNDEHHDESPYVINGVGGFESHRYSELLSVDHYNSIFYTDTVGLNNYFSKNSFGRISLEGSAVSDSWKFLPHARLDASHHYGYIDGSNQRRTNQFIRDCIRTHDDEVDFSQYYGINLLPSRNFVNSLQLSSSIIDEQTVLYDDVSKEIDTSLVFSIDVSADVEIISQTIIIEQSPPQTGITSVSATENEWILPRTTDIPEPTLTFVPPVDANASSTFVTATASTTPDAIQFPLDTLPPFVNLPADADEPIDDMSFTTETSFSGMTVATVNFVIVKDETIVYPYYWNPPMVEITGTRSADELMVTITTTIPSTLVEKSQFINHYNASGLLGFTLEEDWTTQNLMFTIDGQMESNFSYSKKLVAPPATDDVGPERSFKITIIERIGHASEPLPGLGVALIAHEMGHGYNTSHSGVAGGGGAYQSHWDTISSYWGPCNKYAPSVARHTSNVGGVAVNPIPTYGCMPQYMAAFQRKNAGWLTEDEILDVDNNSVQVVTIGSASDPLDGLNKMIRVNTDSDKSNYTIELRTKSMTDKNGDINFDRILPPYPTVNSSDVFTASSVIIHVHSPYSYYLGALVDIDVDTDRYQPYLGYGDGENKPGFADSFDEEARWTEGEVYGNGTNPSLDSIRIEVHQIDEINRTATVKVCTGDQVSQCTEDRTEASPPPTASCTMVQKVETTPQCSGGLWDLTYSSSYNGNGGNGAIMNSAVYAVYPNPQNPVELLPIQDLHGDISSVVGLPKQSFLHEVKDWCWDSNVEPSIARIGFGVHDNHGNNGGGDCSVSELP